MRTRWKQHCRFVKLAQRVTRSELHFIDWLWANGQLQAANKVSGQGESKKKSTRRENAISFTHSRSWENPAHELESNPSLLTPGPVMVWDRRRASSGGDYLCFYRYIRRFSAGQPAITLLPVLRPLLKRLFPKQRFLSLLCQPTAAHHHPQLRKEVWLHAEGHQGVCLWWWRLHRLPYGLGRTSFVWVQLECLSFHVAIENKMCKYKLWDAKWIYSTHSQIFPVQRAAIDSVIDTKGKSVADSCTTVIPFKSFV